jgi:hypothetical protein
MTVEPRCELHRIILWGVLRLLELVFCTVESHAS